MDTVTQHNRGNTTGVAESNFLPAPKIDLDRGNNIRRLSFFSAFLLSLGIGGVGAPKSVTNAFRDLSPTAAAALENLEPRQAVANESESDPQLKFSPSQLEEMKEYGVTAELQIQINESIDKAKSFLIESFYAGGKSWKHLFNASIDTPAGQHALGILALLSRDIDPEEQIVSDLFASSDLNDVTKSNLTYTHALRGLASASYIRALQEKYIDPPENLPKSSATYKKASAILKKSTNYLLKNFNSESEGWRYPDDRSTPAHPKDGILVDVSNTQYAFLALREAYDLSTSRTEKLKIAKIIERAVDYILKTQKSFGEEVQLWITNPDSSSNRYEKFIPWQKAEANGWGYTQDRPASGSMTAAAMACLDVAEYILIKEGLLEPTSPKAKKITSAKFSGLAWMTKNFRLDYNPGSSIWRMYFFHALERFANFYKIKHFVTTNSIGQPISTNWYVKGAEELLKIQSEKGSWPEGGSNGFSSSFIDTCFATLFLKKETRALNTESLPRPVTTPGAKEVSQR
ncbi:MAG: hypothetical protein R3A13_12150 [Bdellovibrionota bacterium]